MKRIILNISLYFFFLLFLFSSHHLLKDLIDTYQTKAIKKNINHQVETNTKGKDTAIDFMKLNNMNSDTIGWVQVKNTHIDYPIVKTINNEYYLTHSFDKSNNVNGWIFMDYKNNSSFNDQNTILFGHNTNNTLMFSELKNIYDGDIDSNISITIYTEKEKYSYQVFSIYLTSEHDKVPITSHVDETSLHTFIKKSVVDFDINVSKEDKILTLSTCHNATNNRIMMHAKKISSEI